MKNVIAALLLSLLVSACQNGSPQPDNTVENSQEQAVETPPENPTPHLSLAWESDTTLITNESVLYHDGRLYVSNIHGNPTDEDGLGSISILHTDGSIAEQSWARGLDAPKGMAIYDGHLMVTDINELVAISLEDPSLHQRYPVEGAQFLNDVAATEAGVYFSDMETGKLHHFASGTVSTVAEGLTGINGLAWSEEEGQLHLLTGTGLHKMNGDGSFTTINAAVTNGDGLIILGEDRYMVSRWQGEIWLVEGDEATQLYDSKEQKVQTADIGYNPEEQVVYVPRFFANKVTAMKLKM